MTKSKLNSSSQFHASKMNRHWLNTLNDKKGLDCVSFFAQTRNIFLSDYRVIISHYFGKQSTHCCLPRVVMVMVLNILHLIPYLIHCPDHSRAKCIFSQIYCNIMITAMLWHILVFLGGEFPWLHMIFMSKIDVKWQAWIESRTAWNISTPTIFWHVQNGHGTVATDILTQE